jgi:hypothetical protein
VIGDLLLAKWAQVRTDMVSTMEKFSDDELNYRPAEASYSAGELMLHVAHEEAIEILWGLAQRYREMPPVLDATQHRTVDSNTTGDRGDSRTKPRVPRRPG